MNRVLVKSLALPFYKSHAGFFFLLFFIGGGFMRSNEHLVLAQYISKSIFLTLIFILFLGLYQIQVFSFLRTTLNTLQFSYIRNLIYLQPREQLLTSGLLYLSLCAVKVIYALFICFIILNNGAYLNFVILGVYLLLSSASFIFLFLRQLKQPIKTPKISLVVTFINKYFNKPLHIWFPLHLLRERPLLLFSSKLLALALIGITFNSYSELEHDWRFIGISTVIALNFNVILAHAWYEFYCKDLYFLKGLPISFFQRILNFTVVAILLSLPEVIVIWRKLPLDFTLGFLIEVTVFIITNVLFFVHLAIIKNPSVEYFGKAALFITLLQVYLVLFGVPFYVLTFLSFIVILFGQRYYYKMDY